MNPITYSLKQVGFKIPKEILEKVFLSNIDWRARGASSLDVEIRHKVIEDRVMVDCNLVGGTETYIDLSGIPRENIDPYTWLFRIPKSKTQGRTITHAFSVGYGTGVPISAGYTQPVTSNALMDAAAGLLTANSPIPAVDTAEVQLVAENTVMVSNALTLPSMAVLRCRLENDSAFNHLNPASYIDFAKLVVLATKSFIWTNAQIPMDKGYTMAGSELGRFAQVIDSYSDAEEQYDTHFNEVWKKVSIMNDPVSKKRHLNAISGGLW